MCEEIMAEVAGCRLPRRPGLLNGFSRRKIKGELYPALVPDMEGAVEGLVYSNLSASAWERLDKFEGDMYFRQEISIKLEDSAMMPAITYVVKPDYLTLVEETEWDFTDFLRNKKTSFQKSYKGYRLL